MLCHFPNMNGQIDPSLVVVLIGLWCKLCGQSSLLICDQCSKRWHMGCLMWPLEELLVGLGMWCSIEDVLCHLLYVCVNSDSCKHWHWYGNAQHFFRVLLYLGGYSLVTIGKLKEASLEQILVWMWFQIIWTFGCDINC